MADYELSRLSSRDFEHITQALATRIIARGVTVFGDGPDGGREATFEGPMDYPSVTNSWNGYLVLQCKHKLRPSKEPYVNADWAADQFNAEFKKFQDPKRELKIPDYYIAVTNVVLSPVADNGGKDKLRALLEHYSSTLGLKGWAIWDYDQICRYLDTQSEIRQAYGALITPGDVLHVICESLGGLAPDFEATLGAFLQAELLTDQYARLERTSAAPEDRTPLARVFTDLDVARMPYDEPPESGGIAILRELLNTGSERLSPSALLETSPETDKNDTEDDEPGPSSVSGPARGRYVLVGGPGQGKSTVAQFICQLHRVALLQERPVDTLEEEARRALASLIADAEANGLELPRGRRFPVRVELTEFADRLSAGACSSMINFVAQRIARRTARQVTDQTLREWLRCCPWILVLDGLDEVPATSNRQHVLQAVREFMIQAKDIDADLLVLATTRPQGYSDDFGRDLYKHFYLLPLSKKRAMNYARRLCDERYGRDKSRADNVFRRIETAFEHDATRRLLKSPLQVTMLAALVDRIGQPPEQRWRLFNEYYSLVYDRETSRESEFARTLSDNEVDIKAIHQSTGIVLQLAAERAGSTDATLARASFDRIVEQRLREEGRSGQALRSLKRDLTEAATDRLVFLVPVREGKIGFEIRSLQEFMAAEAMLTGSDAEVFARLEGMASRPYWRNVFLFAAGKCFADMSSQRFRQSIVDICRRQNEDSSDMAAVCTLAGSRLALELLEEGVARNSPRYCNQLIEIALKLLDLPADLPHDRLASFCSSTFMDAYHVKIKDSQNSTGTWALLHGLLERGHESAERLANEAWPSDLRRQIEFLRAAQRPLLNDWSIGRLVGLLPKVAPWNLELLVRRIRKATFPDRIRSVLQVVNRWSSRAQVDLRLDSGALIHLRYCSVTDKALSGALESLESMSPSAPGWLPLLEGSRFARNPSSRSLAASLRRLAEVWKPGDGVLPDKIPWPLGACLLARGTSLTSLADSAEAGELGDLDSWIEAEARGEVSFEDVFVVQDGHVSDLPSRRPYIPPVCLFPSFDSKLMDEFVQTLMSRHTEVSNSLLSRHAEWVVEALTYMGLNGEVVGIPLDPDNLREIYMRMHVPEVNTSAFAGLSKWDNLDLRWIEFFDWLGRQKWNFQYFYIFVNGVLSTSLARAYNDDPSRLGLLYLLSLFALEGGVLGIDVDKLPICDDIEVDMRGAAVIACLACPGADRVQADRIGRIVVELAPSLPRVGESIQDLFEQHDTAGPWYEAVLISILAHAPASADVLRAAAVRALAKVMAKRDEPLSTSPQWSGLNLMVDEIVDE